MLRGLQIADTADGNTQNAQWGCSLTECLSTKISLLNRKFSSTENQKKWLAKSERTSCSSLACPLKRNRHAGSCPIQIPEAQHLKIHPKKPFGMEPVRSVEISSDKNHAEDDRHEPDHPNCRPVAIDQNILKQFVSGRTINKADDND